jgi:processive 1,2-diacylglycerol beta-glucosyltransferase
MTSPRRVLVLSVSAGAGHVRAAQALCAQAQHSHPQLQLSHLDVMDLVPSTFRKLYSESYIKLVAKAPNLWAYLYERTDRRSRASKIDRLRRGIERLNTTRLNGSIDELAPQAIVCTHFLPAELLSRRIRTDHHCPPVWVQVTDFDVHGLWLHEHMQGYFVASEEVAARLIGKGIAADRVCVSGIPIMPAFNAAPHRRTAAAELGLDPALPTVVMMSGGAGVGDLAALTRQLLEIPRLQIIALAGRNAVLLDELQTLAARAPKRLWPMGFTTTVERIMAAADFAVTKPGGLTSSECLAMNLPMIVISPIPGQEERNADFLLESGAALKAVDAAALDFKIRHLLDNPAVLGAMRERMRAVARPHAARAVLDRVTAQLVA